MSNITFRPLTRADLADVIRWHKAPRAAKWFADSPGDLETAETYFGPSIDGNEPAQVHIMHYLVRDYADYLSAIGDDAPPASISCFQSRSGKPAIDTRARKAGFYEARTINVLGRLERLCILKL